MRTPLKQILLAAIVAIFMTAFVVAQKEDLPEPRRESLLNHLNVLIWKQSNAAKISVNLRIHSGAAFDPQGKEGAMCLLADVMFPGSEVYEDFEDNFGGSLKVTCTYDFVQIETTSDPDSFTQVLEVLAAAIQNPQIDKESTAAAKKLLLARLEEDGRNSASVADLETSERLYGDFAYGRPFRGSTESIERIDFADLLFARQRFLSADNATLSIIGDVRSAYAYRAVRRLFGGWRKGNGRVAANFAVPQAPEITPLTVNTDFGTGIEERIGIETASRPSQEFYASKLLYRVLRERFRNHGSGGLTYNYFLLRGYYLVSRTGGEEKVSDDPNGASSDGAEQLISKTLSEPVAEAEFAQAKASELAEFSGRGLDNNWFDIETYGLKSVKDELSKLARVTLADVNAYASKIKNQPSVKVVLVPLEPAATLDDADPNDPR